jgi:hypothetical protein
MLLRVSWRPDYNRRNIRRMPVTFYLFHHSPPLEVECVAHIENLAGPCSRCPIKDSAVVLGDSPFFLGEGGLYGIP